jgi:hypothetical protein
MRGANRTEMAMTKMRARALSRVTSITATAMLACAVANCGEASPGNVSFAGTPGTPSGAGVVATTDGAGSSDGAGTIDAPAPCPTGTMSANGSCVPTCSDACPARAGGCQTGICAVLDGGHTCVYGSAPDGTACAVSDGGAATGVCAAGACTVVPPTCANAGLACGRFGACSDTSGTPACVCTSDLTGAACDTCAPIANIVPDTFGLQGQHHTVTVFPGAIITSQLPRIPTPNAEGIVSVGQVVYSPSPAKLTIAFSRCPGDVTSFWKTEMVPSGATPIYPCEGETTLTETNLRWIEGTTPGFGDCSLPPGDGPWYVNIKVDYDPSIGCATQLGRCAINFQWN